MLFGDVEHKLIGLGRVFGPKHRSAAGGEVSLELDQQLVEVGDRVLFDLMGGLAPVLEKRNGVGDFASMFAERSAVSPSDFGVAGSARPLVSGVRNSAPVR